MSIAINILEIVKGEMKRHDAKILRQLNLKIGELTAVEPESLQFCFQSIIEGTALEGALLDIEEVPLTGKCSDCQIEFRLEHFFLTTCPGCGEKKIELTSGQDLDIVSMEIE